MKPSEKATELYAKYFAMFPSWIYLDEGWIKENAYTTSKFAKRAAMNAVDEIIEEWSRINSGRSAVSVIKSKKIAYWQEVKLCIEGI